MEGFPLDSSLSQLEIFHRYDLVMIEKNYLLLKRIKNKKNIKFNNFKKYNINLKNQKVLLPNDNIYWVQIKLQNSLLNKIFSFFIKIHIIL